MPLINWNSALALGHSTIDSQHQHLVDLLNQLYDAIQDREGVTILRTVLKELEHYTEYHFSTEDELMRETRHEFAEDHRQEHLEMILRLRDFRNDLESSFASPQLLLEFLQHWLITHIAGADRLLVSALSRNSGLPAAA